MNKPQILVSGATGFVGQHLIPILLDNGHEVIAMGRDENKAKQFDWYKKVKFLSFDYHKSNIRFKPEKGSSLIHLAWQGLPDYMSLDHIENNLPKNYEFIKELIISGISKVLVVGTCLEYGFKYGPLCATDTTNPVTPYAFAKDTLRQSINFLQQEHEFSFQWARLFYMYGKGQNSKSVLAQLDEAIKNGDSTFNMSNGDQLRDYLPVENVAKQLYEIHKNNLNGIYNVCSEKPISIRRLVEKRINEKESSIKINLGYYQYPDYEPMAFWGKK
ncbi:MAG: NAD-dependent epimerase/dehydratase family protein [Gammaproteobacteria bacterium]